MNLSLCFTNLIYMRNYLGILLLVVCYGLAGRAQTGRTSAFGEVDLHRWNDNMSLICQVKKGGAIVSNCELAAFDNQGELRGKAFSHPDLNGLIYLTIQGEGSGVPIHFQAAIEGMGIVDVEESITFSATLVPEEVTTLTIASLLRGDVNGDGEVSIADMVRLVHLLLNKVSAPEGDVDGNGKVDLGDVDALRELLLEKE